MDGLRLQINRYGHYVKGAIEMDFALDLSLTVDPNSAAKLLGVSRSALYRLLRTKGIPEPFRLGKRQPRWLKSELIAWLEAGAPSDAEWQRIKDNNLNDPTHRTGTEK